jgi:hypothetical protein
MLIFQGNKFTIDPNILAIIPFKKIWERDKHPHKENAFAQLMWIYYMHNPRSEFRSYAQHEKSVAILEVVFPKGVKTEWDGEKDELVQEAVTWYRKHVRKNPYWDTWEAYKTAMERLRNKLVDANTTIYEMAKARTELDAWPSSLKKMEAEAIKEDMILDSTSVKKDIKPGEELPKNQRHKD